MWSFRICFGVPDDTLTLSAWDIQARSIVGALKQKKGNRSESLTEAISLIETLGAFFDADTTPALDHRDRLVYSDALEKAAQDVLQNKILKDDPTVKTLINDIAEKKCIFLGETKQK